MKMNSSHFYFISLFKQFICPAAAKAWALAILLVGVASAQALPLVTFEFDTTAPGPSPSPLLSGLSEEYGAVTPDNINYNPTGYFFAATNGQLVQLFKNAGIQSIRIGGNSADGSNSNTNPPATTLDTFFGFAKALNIPVIWTLDLKNGASSQNAAAASYLWNADSNSLEWFDIGNEPEGYKNAYTNFNNWIKLWNTNAGAIISALPGVPLGGMDAWNGGISWDTNFAGSESKNCNGKWQNNIAPNGLTYHYEPLGTANGRTDFNLCIDSLSTTVDNTDFPAVKTIFHNACTAYGCSNFVFTEFNNVVANNDTNANDNTFGYGLFALDALHWWAKNSIYWQNGCLSLHFHARMRGFHGAFYTDSNGDLQGYPLMYAQAAYGVVAQGNGRTEGVTVTNDNNVDVAAYAMGHYNSSGICTNLYVTVLNKTMSTWATNVTVNIIPSGMPNGNVYAMYFVQKNGYPTATNGVTLGNASIDGTGPWQGQWVDVGLVQNDHWQWTVTNLTAVIFDIRYNP